MTSQIVGTYADNSHTFPVDFVARVNGIRTSSIGIKSVSIGQWAGEGVPGTEISIELDFPRGLPELNGKPFDLDLRTETLNNTRPTSPGLVASDGGSYDQLQSVPADWPLSVNNYLSSYTGATNMAVTLTLTNRP